MAKKASGAKSGARAGGTGGTGSRGSSRRSTKAKGGGDESELEPESAPIEVPRPRPLSEIVGHARALATLGSAFGSGRLHHAWIFAGPKGVGKFTAALGFAAAALDPTARVGKDGVPTADPMSRVQQMLRSGTHPDFHVVVKELARFSNDKSVRDQKLRNIPVDVLKHHVILPIELSATLSEGGRASKVFIIDEAEKIDLTGQNQLLKTLEEPAPGSLLILVTSAEESLLPTVRSRCQRVGFSPLSADEMGRWMHTSETFERLGGRELDARTLEWMLSIASGSPGMLVDSLVRGMAEWGPKLVPMLDRAVRGEYVLELGPAMAGIADQLAVAEAERNANASKETANRDAGRIMLRIASERVRQSLRARGGDPEGLERGTRAIDAIVEAERLIDRNVNTVFVMESAVVGLVGAMGRGR